MISHSIQNYKKYIIFIAAIFLLKILLLGIHPFHYPSEARYAAIAMRMELTGNYLMPYFDVITPFFGKPPLSFWISALSFKLFGFSEFAGRLPQLVFLMISCFLVFNCVAKIADKKTAASAIVLLVASPLFYVLDSIMTESALLLGMTMITTSFWLQIESDKPKNIYGYLFFLGCVIAMLSKGLVGILMTAMSIFLYLLISKRWKEFFSKFPIFSGGIIFVLMALPWFILAEMKYPGFLEYFFIGENFNRFAKPGWEGDRYGSAHSVRIGMIWCFFVLAVLPILLAFFSKPKQLVISVYDKIRSKSDQKSLFFLVSFLSPFLVLTFTRNMILTYSIYSFVSFVVLMSFILAENNRDQFVTRLAGFTVIMHVAAITLFLVKPQNLMIKINTQDYLVRQIPSEVRKQDNFELYYFVEAARVFTLSWYTKDHVKVLDDKSFPEFIEKSKVQKKYVIGDLQEYLREEQKYPGVLNKIVCVGERSTCLFESKNGSDHE